MLSPTIIMHFAHQSLRYPDGPARNPTSVQRGSVQFLSIYPGDPTTPGYPAYENATRTEGTNIPSIPSLPISWANAQVLLKEISGAEPEAAFGMLGKPSEKKIKLVNHGKRFSATVSWR